MKETYCVANERKTPCVEPSGFQRDKKRTIRILL